MKDVISNSPNNFNLLVMPFDFTLRTIRNLKACHIPLLCEMKSKALEVISKYVADIDKSKLHCEFHYTPSTYHLHLHVGCGKDIEKEKNKRHVVYKLDDVIKWLEADSEHFVHPHEINVKNPSEWKVDLEKYFCFTNDKLTTNDDGWLLFSDMDCYTKYNNL